MNVKFPSHLNLEFCINSHQSTKDENALLCHIEVDDYGNTINAIPLSVNVNGHITLDFKNAICIKPD